MDGEDKVGQRFEVVSTESPTQSDLPTPPNLVGRLLKGYVLICKIDEGSFGAVFLGKLLTKEKISIDKNFDHKTIPENDFQKYRVVKAESNFTEGGCGLKIEVEILKKLHENFPKTEHFVQIDDYGRRNLYSYVFMTLLGKSIKELAYDAPGGQFSIGTWSRIGIQGLLAIKQLHEIGYVHRDLKPANFVLGHPNDSSRSRFIHLIDFGLARKFVTVINGVKTHRKARRIIDFRGTEFYCSQSMHFELEQERIDDIWSLIFTLMEMHKRLPWSYVKSDEIEAKKKSTKLTEILNLLPPELDDPLKKLNGIERRKRPNYEDIYKGLCNVMIKNKCSFKDPYDWETIVNPKSPSMEKFSCMFNDFKNDRLAGLVIPDNNEKELESARSINRKAPVETDVSVCYGSNI
uniref:non-specific serine/threonine protein kinase n=1 Tax=Strongyloides venezuelensis TaxID=75913 RepID=A0A0K0FPQ2_STRVS